MTYKLLVINPGSTSTKVSIFENENQLIEETLRHTAEELEPYTSIFSQLEYRKNLILSFLEKENYSLTDFDAFVGRGGLVRPLQSGTYEVCASLLEDLKTAKYGEHASNLGAILASDLANKADKKAYISDPVVVDELEDIARITGLPQIERKSMFHALNQKATARKYAEEVNKDIKDLNLIVCHMGGGISVGVHKGGRVIDVNNCIDGVGPFSPERAGTMPAGDVARLCFSGDYALAEVIKMLNGKGGLMAHLGENQAHHIRAKAEAGNVKYDLILTAMTYNIAKEIGAAATVLEGKIDAILLTGGMAYNDFVCSRVIKRIEFIAPIKRYPGEDEMGALAGNILRILNGKEELMVY